ncbi:urea carboxylase [Clostridia bacterium]|nr:urea carboxylase [Clostridia bacterium]
MTDNVILTKKISTGDRWSGNIGRGKLLRFRADADGANLSALFYNFYNLSEHYNAPDTLKAQHTFYLTKGHALISDCGRALASIVQDDLGWHDSVTGYTTKSMTDAKYGATSYQTHSNNYLKNGQDNFINELTKNGMSKRDLMPPVNFFTKVDADEEGNLIFDADHYKAGAEVTIRTEMAVYMVLSNTPNPLNPSREYPKATVTVEVLNAPEVNAFDYCVNHSVYTRRAFENTWEYNLLLEVQ